MSGVKIHVLNIAPMQAKNAHGTSTKTLAVLHETVSPDIAGLTDILGVEGYLAKIGYGIHGLTDLEGNMAWGLGQGNDVFWQAGGVNTESVGIEQVSDIPAYLAAKKITMEQAKAQWAARSKQLHATAQLLACWHAVDPTNHVLAYVDGTGAHKGVTTHWDVSQHHSESEGHTDCHPVTHGGYYPVIEVVDFAKTYAKLGYHF
jgi:hypothetical protein